MSTPPPSPLKAIAARADELLKYEFTVAAYRAGLSEIWRLASEDTAFDALLAVAKAVDARIREDAVTNPPDGIGTEIAAAVRDLDAAHPGWREWAP